MKKFFPYLKRFVLLCIAVSGVAVTVSSCDPDDIDAFADGYRQGYYGNYNSINE